jgi:hypothetical protein
MKWSYLVLLFSASILLFSCKSDTITGGKYTPVDSSSFTYPFTSGSSWNYTYTATISNIRPDSIRHYFSQYPVTASGSVTILYDTVINSINTKCFLDSYTESGVNRLSRVYYANNDTALLLTAYNLGASPFTPGQQHNKIYFSSNGNYFECIHQLAEYFSAGANNIFQTDSLYLQIPPDTALKYPVKTGVKWIYKFLPPGDTITRKYTDFENISIGNNVISCIKTQVNFTYFSNAIAYNYFSKYGLVKSDYQFNDELVTNEFGQTVGYVNIEEVHTVTSYNIINP